MIRFDLYTASSPIAGRGVYAAGKIPRRNKIGNVTGELISIRKARKRARESCSLCLIDVSDT